MKCMALNPQWAGALNVLYYDQAAGFLKYYYISMNGFSNWQKFIMDYSASTEFMTAVIVSEYNMYYFGGTKSITKLSKTYSQMVGFIQGMNTAYTQCMIYQTNATSMSVSSFTLGSMDLCAAVDTQLVNDTTQGLNTGVPITLTELLNKQAVSNSDACPTQDIFTLQAPTIVKKTYIINSVTAYSINQFSTNASSCTDYQPWITLKQVGNIALPSFMTFYPNNYSLALNSTSLSHMGNYTLNYTVTINNGQTNSTTFQIEVIPKCYYMNVAVNNTQLTDQTYDISNSTALRFAFLLNWALTNYSNGCSSTDLKYTYVIDSTNVTVDPTVFYIDQSFGTAYVNTTDALIVGTYDIRIDAMMAGQNKGSSQVFYITIVDECSQNPMITVAQPDLVYYLNDTKLNITLPTFTDSSGLCGKITYTLTYANGSALAFPYYFSAYFNNTFTAGLTSSATYAAITDFNYTGQFAIGGQSASVAFSVTIMMNPCKTAVITAPTYGDQILYINKPDQVLTIPSFITNTTGLNCGGWLYTIEPTVSPPIASIFSTDVTVPSITMDTDDITKRALSPYGIKVTGYQANYTLSNATLIFKIYINYFDPMDCPKGFYYQPKGETCEPCSSPCTQCVDLSTQCIWCEIGQKLIDDGVSFSCIPTTDDCPVGTWQDPQLDVCRGCPLYCETCSSMDSCNVCISTYTLNNGQCMPKKECSDNYRYEQTNNTCTACPSNCVTCSSATNCTYCSVGYYRNETTGSCASSCSTGSYADSNSQSCMICQTDCAECNTNNYTCTKCKTGSYLFNKTCVKRCPYLGYYQNPLTNTCDACQTGCEICISTTTDCLTCVKGYARTGRSCSASCTDEYYLTTSEICFQCDPACFKCNGSEINQCQYCNAGYYLYGSTCSVSCPNLMFTDNINRECAGCAYYCANCTSKTSCQLCNPGYITIPNSCQGEYYLKTSSQYSMSVPMNTTALAIVDPKETTFEIWFKPSDVNSTTGQIILGVSPYIVRKMASKNSVELLFGNTVSFCSDNSLIQDQWYHFAFAIRENSALLTCYLNGELINTGSSSTISITKNVTKPTELTLGGTIDPLATGDKFDGYLKEFRWWKTYRSQFQITNFKNVIIQSYLTQMYAYWRLDEKNDGSVTTYADKANILTHTPLIKTVAQLQEMREVYLKLCPEGQYQNFNYTAGYFVCQNCDSSCKSCNNNTALNCTDCNSPLKLLQAEQKCIMVDTCPDGYYQDPLTGLCTPCTSSCLTCVNGPDQCPICKKGYFRQYQGQSCVASCPTGMYGNYTSQQCFFYPIITIIYPNDGDDYSFGTFMDLVGFVSLLNKEINGTYSISWKVIKERGWLDVSDDAVKPYAGGSIFKVHLENRVIESNNYYNISMFVVGNDTYYKGFNASVSIRIYFGIPPKNGKCLSSNATGKADLDIFTLTQPGWIDPSGISSYEFSYSFDGGVIYTPIESPDSTKPTIDIKFPQTYEDYQVTIKCSAINNKGFLGTTTTSIGILKKLDANATYDILKFKLTDYSSEADFISYALQLNMMAKSIGALQNLPQTTFDPKIENSACSASLCWGRGTCKYESFTKKYYCSCGLNSEGSNCTFSNSTILYLLQDLTSTLTTKYQQLTSRNYEYEYLKLTTQYKEQLNDSSLPLLIDIVRTKVWEWNGKYSTKDNIQKHLVILSNLMEYIEYDLLRQNNTGYWQNKTLKLIRIEENIQSILEIVQKLLLITRTYLNQMTNTLQFTTRMFAYRQSIITQESIVTFDATNQSKIISTRAKISPANFYNSKVSLEDAFIVEALEHAVNPYQIENLNNLATNAFELKFYNLSNKKAVEITNLTQGIEFYFPVSDNHNLTDFLETYNSLSPFKTLQRGKRVQLLKASNMACTFWNGTSWDTTGCKFMTIDTTHIRCSCTHLTTFGTLFNTPVLALSAATEDSSLIKADTEVTSVITLEELIRWPIMDYINNLQELLQHKQPTLLDFLLKPGVYIVLVFWFFYITSIVFYSGKDRMKRYNMTKSQNRDDLAEMKDNEVQCLDQVVRDLIIRDRALVHQSLDETNYDSPKKQPNPYDKMQSSSTYLTQHVGGDPQQEGAQQLLQYEEMPKDLKKKYKKRARRKIFGKVGTLNQRAKRYYKRTIKKSKLSAEAKSKFFNDELKLNLWFGLMAKTSKIAPRHVRVTLMYFHIAYHLFMSSFIHIFKLQAYIIDDEGMFKYITLSGIIVFSAQIISLPLALIFRMPMSVRRMIEGVKTKKVNKAYIELDRQMGWRYAIGYFFCICTYIVATFTVLFFNYFYPQDYCISWMMNLAFLYLIDYLLLTFSFAGIQLLNVIIASKLKCWYHVWATLEKYRYIKNLRG